MKFNVGDRVEIVGSGDRYLITRDGSYGVITEDHSKLHVVIQFEFTTGYGDLHGTPVSILKKHLKLKPYTKLEKALK
jgi:hypothetical protein